MDDRTPTGDPRSEGVPVVVLVPGYGGRAPVVERWRMAVAVATLAAHGSGRLVVSGHGGEAERLAALAPDGVLVDLEPTARSTFENVERSIPFFADAHLIAVASDRGHRRRAVRYLASMRPDLVPRLVDPTYPQRSGWLMDAAGEAFELWSRVKRSWSDRRTASS